MVFLVRLGTQQHQVKNGDGNEKMKNNILSSFFNDVSMYAVELLLFLAILYTCYSTII